MRRTLAVVASLLVVSSACGAPETETSVDLAASDGRPVVIDTDMGPDDVVALLYLLQRPEVEVLAVTVSGDGLAHCEAGTARAAGVLALSGAADVPVACGSEEPLEGVKAFPTSWRVATDAMSGMTLPAGAPPDARPAVQLLADVLDAATEPVTVLTLGPLTTLAELLRDAPHVADQVAGVVVMGGALDVPGNILQNPVAEWNVWVDALAADEVLRSGLDVSLVPLDATNDVPQTVYLYETLARQHDGPAATAWFDYLTANPFQYAGTQYLWDEATAALLVTPDLATWEDSALTVARDVQETRGQLARTTDGPRVHVARAVDRDRLEGDLLATLVGTTVEPVAPHPDVTVVHDTAAPTLEVAGTLRTGALVVDVDNRTDAQVGVAILRLTDGATEADLRALTTPDPPAWVQVLHSLVVQGGDLLTVQLPVDEPGTYWIATVGGPSDRPVVLGDITVD